MAHKPTFRTIVPATSSAGRFTLWTARAAVVGTGALGAFEIGPWSGGAYLASLSLFGLARAVKALRPATTTNPPATDPDDSVTSNARTRARQEMPGSHSGITGSGESAAGGVLAALFEHLGIGNGAFDADAYMRETFGDNPPEVIEDCPICSYPWRTGSACGYCGHEGTNPAGDRWNLVPCPRCDWRPVNACERPECASVPQPWCQYCTWKPGHECPDCSYPTPVMRDARNVADAMTPTEYSEFLDELMAGDVDAVTADGPVSAAAMSADELLWLDELGHVDTGDPDGQVRRAHLRAFVRRWLARHIAVHVFHVRNA